MSCSLKGKTNNLRKPKEEPFIKCSVNNVCLYPGAGKFKLPKGTQEVASFSKVWITSLKNLAYFGRSLVMML